MKGQTMNVCVSSGGAIQGDAIKRFPSLWKRIGRWYELGRQRRQLACMSDAGLKDLGLSRADIYQESERPFWDDPFCK
jgi:uncharacterized protein YjiS (DUF1127 family)